MVEVFYHSAPFEMGFAHFDVQNMPPAAADHLGATCFVPCWFVLPFGAAGLLLSCFGPLSDLISGLTGAVAGRVI